MDLGQGGAAPGRAVEREKEGSGRRRSKVIHGGFGRVALL